MNIDASITISRNSNDTIRIAIKDRASGVRFAEVELTPHDFGMAVTGLSEIPVPCVVRELDVVGKTKIMETRTVACPLTTHERAPLRAWVVEHCQEPGWRVSCRLDTQGSVQRSPCGGQLLRYTVYRYEHQA